MAAGRATTRRPNLSGGETVPRLSIALSWTVFGVLTALGLFGGLLGLPDEMLAVSPITAIPELPAGDGWPAVAWGVGAVAAIVVAALAFRRRDLTTCPRA
jgi:ABC-2 type transport system permease protein